MNLLIISTFKSYKMFQHVLISFIISMVSVIVSILVVVFFSIGMSHMIHIQQTISQLQIMIMIRRKLYLIDCFLQSISKFPFGSNKIKHPELFGKHRMSLTNDFWQKGILGSNMSLFKL